MSVPIDTSPRPHEVHGLLIQQPVKSPRDAKVLGVVGLALVAAGLAAFAVGATGLALVGAKAAIALGAVLLIAALVVFLLRRAAPVLSSDPIPAPEPARQLTSAELLAELPFRDADAEQPQQPAAAVEEPVRQLNDEELPGELPFGQGEIDLGLLVPATGHTAAVSSREEGMGQAVLDPEPEEIVAANRMEARSAPRARRKRKKKHHQQRSTHRGPVVAQPVANAAMAASTRQERALPEARIRSDEGLMAFLHLALAANIAFPQGNDRPAGEQPYRLPAVRSSDRRFSNQVPGGRPRASQFRGRHR